MMLLGFVSAIALMTGLVSWIAGNRSVGTGGSAGAGSPVLVPTKATRARLAAMQLLGDTHAAVEGGGVLHSGEVAQSWASVRLHLAACDGAPVLLSDLDDHFALVQTYLDVEFEALLDSSGAVSSAARHLAGDICNQSPVLVGRLAAGLTAPDLETTGLPSR